MFTAFFTLGAQSLGRQSAFRRLVVVHVVYVLAVAWLGLAGTPGAPQPMLGHLLLVAGIIEGAVLLGWRLTQLPKSQALEFFLVSPIRPAGVFLGEAAVGLAYLGLLTLSGLPVLLLLVVVGYVDPIDVTVLLVLPWTWGAMTGLGLTVWAYEPQRFRRWGERGLMLLILAYLVVGVLAGEQLRRWLDVLPGFLGVPLLYAFRATITFNPFGMIQRWFLLDVRAGWPALLIFELATLAGLALLLGRGAWRLLGHFHEWHYTPQMDVTDARRPPIGNEPLAWWAVKRVSRYAGRINVYLAGGFCLLYAAYILAGSNWPGWMGFGIFRMCDGSGGVSMLATILVLLAAVPAAFQYGLWDSNTSDRLRRLELLLLTELEPRDYWNAALAAAWSRGRDYLIIAAILGLAGWLGGRLSLVELFSAIAVATLVWTLYFALGFQAFARGQEANGLGLLLTVGLPLGTVVLYQIGLVGVAQVLPPGSLFGAGGPASGETWLLGALLAAVTTLAATRMALACCDRQLRHWYDRHSGARVIS